MFPKTYYIQTCDVYTVELLITDLDGTEPWPGKPTFAKTAIQTH